MKLHDYVSKVIKVLAEHIDDAETRDMIAAGHGWEKGSVKAGFDRIYREIRESLARNKDLLGVHQRSGPGPDKPEVLKEREIDPKNLKRHILAVRYDMRHYGRKINTAADRSGHNESPESIMMRVLNDLTAALGVKDLGGVFSPDEKEQYEVEFGRSQRLKKEPPAKDN